MIIFFIDQCADYYSMNGFFNVNVEMSLNNSEMLIVSQNPRCPQMSCLIEVILFTGIENTDTLLNWEYWMEFLLEK